MKPEFDPIDLKRPDCLQELSRGEFGWPGDVNRSLHGSRP
ncbi:hypothetical protein L901_19360 [Agrobacterium sp. D14]|nr:hypothetical protein L901_19360 [Agrobacterium sp. D14]